jgi:hypothetical protein
MSSGKDRLFSSSDIQLLLTFVAGMGAFWLSGNLPSILHINFSITGHQILSFAANLCVALVIYGVIMFGWSLALLRSRGALKPSLMAATTAIILALISSLILTWMGLHGVAIPLAVLAFILYFVYGAYFIIGLAVARRLAR